MKLEFKLIQYQWHIQSRYNVDNTHALLSTSNNSVWNPKCIAFVGSIWIRSTRGKDIGWEPFPEYIKLINYETKI